MIGDMLDGCRRRKPLVHCITNYVTANDCANILLACGGSAIMADDPREAAEVAAQADGLVLNLGTLNPSKLEAMLAAGREANRKGIPVVLDPVGAAAVSARREAAQMLLDSISFAVIRGNAAEIAALAGMRVGRRGVDAAPGMASDDIEEAARILAGRTGAAAAATGAVDVVTDGDVLFRVYNGHPVMRLVTGTGCQTSALIGAYAAANPDCQLHAALAAVCAMGLCGETAAARMTPQDGNASCRNYLIDAVFNLTKKELEKGARYEIC